MNIAEEGLEMLSIVLFIYALLAYMRARGIDWMPTADEDAS